MSTPSPTNNGFRTPEAMAHARAVRDEKIAAGLAIPGGCYSGLAGVADRKLRDLIAWRRWYKNDPTTAMRHLSAEEFLAAAEAPPPRRVRSTPAVRVVRTPKPDKKEVNRQKLLDRVVASVDQSDPDIVDALAMARMLAEAESAVAEAQADLEDATVKLLRAQTERDKVAAFFRGEG